MHYILLQSYFVGGYMSFAQPPAQWVPVLSRG